MGIVHRDLKPDNIMIAKGRGGADMVKVVDFGIAKAAASDNQKVTKTGMVVGTPEYMSPEQVRGERGDFQSDIYAVGIVLFEMLTGAVPFRGGNVLATMQMQLTDKAPLDGDRPDRLPIQLVPVLRKALAKDAGERYASARGMATALRLVLETLAAPALVVVPTLWENGSDLEPAHESPDPQDQAELLRALVLRLSVGDVPERCVAALTLGRMALHAQVQDAVPALVEALNDPHPHVAEAAAGALRRIAGTSPAPVPATPVPAPAPATAEPPPVIDLIDMLRHPDATLRLIAVEALGESRSVSRETIPVLAEVLQDKDEEVGREAARALGKIGAVAAVPSLVVALSDAPEIVRISAAKALGRMGPRATVAIPGLIAALEHADDKVSDAAAEALLTIGLGATPALIEAVPDHNERLSLRAAAVLTKVVSASAMRWVERLATAVRPGA
jgi:HEAT repeat protein